MTTMTATILAYKVDDLKEAVAKLAKIAAKIDAPAPELVVLDRFETTTQKDDDFVTEVWFNVEILNAYPVVAGGYQFVAAIDHIAEGVNMVRVAPEFRDMDLTHLNTVTSRCDQCHVDRLRLRTYFFKSEDGTEVQVGSTCMTDFLGHKVKFHWYETLDEILDDDEMFGRSRGGGGGSRYSVIDYAMAAATLINHMGFRKADQEGAATKNQMAAFLMSNQGFDNVPKMTDEQREEAQAAIQWILDLEADSEYLRNLQTVFKYDLSERKYHGLIASFLTAYRRHLGWIAEQAAREIEVKTPVITGEKVQITGTVVSVDLKETDWGYREVMTVKDDRGFKVWGTRPAKISDCHAGDKVSFIASVERSSEDESFGFYKRPTKVTIEYINNPVH